MLELGDYVAILKGKQGEYNALNSLDNNVIKKLKPLIEIPPIDYNFETNKEKTTLDEHLIKAAKKISKYLQGFSITYIDLRYHEQRLCSDGTHALYKLYQHFKKKSAVLIPVTGLRRKKAYQTSIYKISKQEQNGICLRLDKIDLLNTKLKHNIDAFLINMGIAQSEIDLILDFQDLSKNLEDIKDISVIIKHVINNLPYATRWGSLIFAATGFPLDLSNIKPDNITEIPRIEWEIWISLKNYHDLKQLKRLPVFGDYAIANPEMVNIDPRAMDPSASIRYTIDDGWIIVKGRRVKKHGYNQYHDLSESIILSNDYSGENFSWGDKFIKECSNPPAKTGNLTTWRQVGTSHHITYVVEQLSSVFGP